MTIYVTGARADRFLAAVRQWSARSPGTRYAIVRVPHTWADLKALARRIESASGRWRARGLHLLAADPDAAASKVIVTVRGNRAAAADALTAAYGDDWIRVASSQARYIPLGNHDIRQGSAGRDPSVEHDLRNLTRIRPWKL